MDAGVYFGGDPASPDTLGKFYWDVQMFTNGPDNTDPQTYLAGWLCKDGDKVNIANSGNDWLGNNTERWCSPEYDAKHAELKAATDPAKRAALAIELNDMLAQNYVNLPLVFALRSLPITIRWLAWISTAGTARNGTLRTGPAFVSK